MTLGTAFVGLGGSCWVVMPNAREPITAALRPKRRCGSWGASPCPVPPSLPPGPAAPSGPSPGTPTPTSLPWLFWMTPFGSTTPTGKGLSRSSGTAGHVLGDAAPRGGASAAPLLPVSPSHIHLQHVPRIPPAPLPCVASMFARALLSPAPSVPRTSCGVARALQGHLRKSPAFL